MLLPSLVCHIWMKFHITKVFNTDAPFPYIEYLHLTMKKTLWSFSSLYVKFPYTFGQLKGLSEMTLVETATKRSQIFIILMSYLPIYRLHLYVNIDIIRAQIVVVVTLNFIVWQLWIIYIKDQICLNLRHHWCYGQQMKRLQTQYILAILFHI